jgi:hypothetical protein
MKQIDLNMEKYISDEEYVSFVNNSLPTSKMLEVEQYLIHEGEADATILSAITNYEINKKEADETWGFDNDVLIEQNNFDKNVGNDTSDTLRGRTLKNNRKMKLNITQEEVLTVQELSKKFFENEDKSVSTEQNLINFGMDMRPGTTPQDALSYVQGIVKGVASFTDTLNEVVKNGSIDYKSKLREVASNLSMNDKYTMYLNFLVALGNLDATTFSIDKLVAVDEFEQLRGSAYEINDDVTQEQLDDLIEQIDSALANNTFCLATTDAISNLVTQLPGGTKTVTEFLNSNVDDIKRKHVMALCTYIAYLNDDLKSIPEGMTAEMIGISTAAGIEQEKIMNDVKSGRTTFETAAHWIKIIGGVALYCGLTVIVAIAGAYLGVMGMAAICSLIGWSMFAMVIAAAISILGVCSLSGYAADAIGVVTDFAGRTYDKFVEYVRTTAYPWVSEKIQSIIAFIRNLFESGHIKANSHANAAPQVVMVNA